MRGSDCLRRMPRSLRCRSRESFSALRAVNDPVRAADGYWAAGESFCHGVVRLSEVFLDGEMAGKGDFFTISGASMGGTGCVGACQPESNAVLAARGSSSTRHAHVPFNGWLLCSPIDDEVMSLWFAGDRFVNGV